ncbi:MAG TPA: redoxin domain-containing protein [Thermoanaerobaculia bacterium]|nr:redoxin domain-containing protein [Thermoanaerobaculia bacterium]
MRIRPVWINLSIAFALTVTAALAQQTMPLVPAQDKPAKAAASKPAVPAQPFVTVPRFTMAAGDLTGDGISESIIYDTATKAIRVIGYDGEAPFQTIGIYVKDVVSEMATVDLDGDKLEELVTGEGLGGYNSKEGPQTDVSIKIYKPRTQGDWTPVEVYRRPTERAEVSSLVVKDLDGDGQKEILFAYFASKYLVDVRVAKRSGDGWTVTEMPSIRMGAHVDAGDVMEKGKSMIVVGRPYGDPASPTETTAIGGAFVIDGDKRIALPVTRGVSSIAVGDLIGDERDEIVVADGWHSNYGKLARCRIGLVSRQGSDWKYELIEDLDAHLRFEKIDLVDLTGDGKPEIVAWASLNATLGGSVRVYERTSAGGWRGMTAGAQAQTFAAGDFNNDKKRELVFAGQPPLPFSLASKGPNWEKSLGKAVDTRDVDSKSLLEQSAPALKPADWIGSKTQTLKSLQGKVVLLDFWATWCKPCIEMYPEMRTWVDEFKPQGLVILGITNLSRQTLTQVQRFFERQKLPWPVVVDPKNGTHIEYGVSPIPHTFLIDRKGVVRLEHRGGGDLTAIKTKIKELLAETAVAAK